MTYEVIKNRLEALINVPLLYNRKKTFITTFTIDKFADRVFIHVGHGMPEQRNFTDMEQFFKRCIPYNHKMDKYFMETDTLLETDILTESEVEEKFDTPPAVDIGIADHILTDEELDTFDIASATDMTHHKKNSNHSKQPPAILFTSPQDIKCTINDVRNILMDTIKKVQANKEYIQQANTVNQSVNTLINLAKLSLQLIQNK